LLPCLGATLLFSAAVTAQVPALLGTWNSNTAFVAPSGPQPVNGWYYKCYRRNLTHTSADMLDMTWVAHTPPGWQTPTNRPGWSLPGSVWSYFAVSGGRVEQGTGELAGVPVDPVRGWQAPQAGTVVISSSDNVALTFSSTQGDGFKAQIWRNDMMMWEREIPANMTLTSPGAAPIPNVTFPVNQGDFVWFHADHNTTTGWDGGIVFNPIIDLFSSPAGYSTATVNTNSVSAFNNTQPQGHASHQGWSYWTCDRTVTPNAYAQMTATGTDAHGAYWSDASSYTRVWSDRAHPSWSKDAVRRWTAAVDGTVLIAPPTTQPNLVKTYGQGDPVRVLAYHTNSAGVRTELYDEVVEIGKAANMGLLVHMRAGEFVDLHLRWHTSNSFNWYVTTNLNVALHPAGAPQPAPLLLSATTAINSPASSPTSWFHRDVRITGNLDIQGHVAMDHCFVQLVNASERQYSYNWNANGVLRTRNTSIGGNVLANGTVFHSNFNLTAGKWFSRNTTVRYTYGQLLNNGAVLEGRRHMAGPHADTVILPGNGSGVSTVKLTDSRYTIAAAIPCNNSSPVTLSLPVDSPQTMTAGVSTIGTNNVPGALWNLELVNTIPQAAWHVPAHHVGSTPKTINLTNAPRLALAVHHDGGQTGSGHLVTGSPSGPFQTFGVTWNVPSSSEILGWGAYFNDTLGSSDITLTAPSRIHELMVFDNASVAGNPTVRFQGNQGQFDAKSNATTIWASGPQARLTLAEAELGTDWTSGEIKSSNDAVINIRHARRPAGSLPLYLNSTDDDGTGPRGPGRFVIENFHDAYDPTKVILTGPGPFEIYPGTSVSSGTNPARWNFATGIDGWLNWQTGVAPWFEHGFLTTAPSWTSQAGALHLEYPSAQLPNGTLVPRIVAPGSNSTTFDYTINGTPRADLYLVVRVLVKQASPRQNALGQDVCGLYFGGRSGGNWATWNQYFRQMEVQSDGNWHVYVWNINNPTAPGNDPILGFNAGWAPLPANLDIWSLTFHDASGIDVFDLGDYVDLDYVVITDDPRGWNRPW
jgi:hypothetical protein